MANSDYNAIKPVEGLQNIGRVSGVERRRERKRRQDTQQDKHEEFDEEVDEAAEEAVAPDEGKGGSGHSIDYCA